MAVVAEVAVEDVLAVQMQQGASVVSGGDAHASVAGTIILVFPPLKAQLSILPTTLRNRTLCATY